MIPDDESDALDILIKCREADLQRTADRVSRAERSAAGTLTVTLTIFIGLATALAALQPHLHWYSLLLVVLGAVPTLLAVIYGAITWNPSTRGAVTRSFARVPFIQEATPEIRDAWAKLMLPIPLPDDVGGLTARRIVSHELGRKIEAAKDLITWSERRTAQLGLLCGSGICFLTIGTVVTLASR
jgi:hypothetical protein